MESLVLIVHVLFAVSIVALVLLQHGKGADAGASFGSGASNTMFGSVGATPFLLKVTAILAAGFFASSIALGYLNSRLVRNQQHAIIPSTTQPMSAPSSAENPSPK